MKATLIYNPLAGTKKPKAALLPGVVARMEEQGWEVTPEPTEHMGHATEIARAAAEAGANLAIAWGGDGTLNEVACGLVGSETALGVLPGGTVNVFARETGIPLRLDGALDALFSGRRVRIPVGLANGRVFLLMAGVGLDGEVVYRIKSGFKHALGALAFWLDGFKMLATYPFEPFRVRYEGGEVEGTAVIAAKLRRYGPRYSVAPDAELEEPLLDVVVLQGRTRIAYLRYLVGVLGGFHLRFSDVRHFKTDSLEVDAGDRAHSRMQLDGEPAGFAPVKLTVRDRALTVVVP